VHRGLLLVLPVRRRLRLPVHHHPLGRRALHVVLQRAGLLGFRGPLIGLALLVSRCRLHVAAIEAGVVVLILKQKLVSILFLGILNCLYHLGLISLNCLFKNLV